MQANLSVVFDLTPKDQNELSYAIVLLEKVKDEFIKCGDGNKEEIETLKHASHILDSIIRGEAF